ncbi:unnamed protein product [Timema podura]|uniref:Fanconi-associated nuclease n=1 Tax=Timema podura TaxID=61482 RepID=A0ABN7NWF8_TIMPD|nr:unnamed protein product [Timema podura]
MLDKNEEIKVIKSFCDHSTLSKKLYIRMFTRKFTWHRVSDIKYEEIGQDMSEVFHELEFRDYVSSGEQVWELVEMLNDLNEAREESRMQINKKMKSMVIGTKRKMHGYAPVKGEDENESEMNSREIEESKAWRNDSIVLVFTNSKPLS